MASFILYNNFKLRQLDGNGVDFDADTLKVALVTDGYAPDIDTHDFFDDASGSEVSSTGYTAGGATLSGVTLTQDNTNNRAVFDADDVTWTNVTFSPRYGIVYKVSGGAGTSPLIGYIDFGATQEAVGVDFQIRWSADGILWAQ